MLLFTLPQSHACDVPSPFQFRLSLDGADTGGDFCFTVAPAVSVIIFCHGYQSVFSVITGVNAPVRAVKIKCPPPIQLTPFSRRKRAVGLIFLNFWLAPHRWCCCHALCDIVIGVDIHGKAIRIVSFSLSLAMCDYLEPRNIWETLIFSRMLRYNLFESDFFEKGKFKKQELWCNHRESFMGK